MQTTRSSRGFLFWLTLPLVGPVWTLPVALWRQARYHVRSRTMRRLLLAPGCYALVVAVAAWLTSYAEGARWRRWSMLLHELSPLHVVARDLQLAVRQTGRLSPLEAFLNLSLASVLLTLSCTIFLAPVYHWLTAEDAR